MATITVRIPGLLARFANESREHQVTAGTVEEAVTALIETYPELAPHVLNQKGERRAHLQVYINDQNIEWIEQRPIPVEDGDSIELFQAVSGG